MGYTASSRPACYYMRLCVKVTTAKVKGKGKAEKPLIAARKVFIASHVLHHGLNQPALEELHSYTHWQIFSHQHPLSHSCCLSHLSHMSKLLAGVKRLPFLRIPDSSCPFSQHTFFQFILILPIGSSGVECSMCKAPSLNPSIPTPKDSPVFSQIFKTIFF